MSSRAREFFTQSPYGFQPRFCMLLRVTVHSRVGTCELCQCERAYGVHAGERANARVGESKQAGACDGSKLHTATTVHNPPTWNSTCPCVVGDAGAIIEVAPMAAAAACKWCGHGCSLWIQMQWW